MTVRSNESALPALLRERLFFCDRATPATMGLPLGLCLAQAQDRYFRRVFECALSGLDAPRQGLVVLAAGNYGRRCLAPGADIDLLILFSYEPPPWALELTKTMLHPLWDAGFEVGHACRGLDETLALAKADAGVLSGLMGFFTVCGDGELAARLRYRLVTDAYPASAEMMRMWINQRRELRAREQGDGASLMEPHLKEGLGGLRDGQEIHWALRVFGRTAQRALFPEWRREHAKAMRRLAAFRHALHLSHPKSGNRLTRQAQPAVAARLGYPPGREGLGLFLGDLGQTLATLRALRDDLPGLLPPWDYEDYKPSLLAEAPALESGLILDAAERMAARGEGLNARDRFFVRRALSTETTAPDAGPPHENASPDASRSAVFERLGRLLETDETGLALRDLQETGLLARLVPELASLTSTPGFDEHHLRPVGAHTLTALALVRELAADAHGALGTLYRGLMNPRTLLWAILFHDAGKGRGGKHAVVGARLAAQALTRMKAPKALTADVCYLVAKHLFLSEAVGRTDPEDEAALARIAKKIRTPERLAMLYLLSVADARATGPDASNAWKSSLLGRLFYRLQSLMEGGVRRDSARALKDLFEREHEPARLAALASLADNAPIEMLRFCDAPFRDMVFTVYAELLDAVEDASRRATSASPTPHVLIHQAAPAPDGVGWRLVFAADKSGRLFPSVALGLALLGVEAWEGRAFRLRDGTSMSVWRIKGPPDPYYAKEFFDTLAGRVLALLEDRLDLDDVRQTLGKRRNSLLAAPVCQEPASFRFLKEDGCAPCEFLEIQTPSRLTTLAACVLGAKRAGARVLSARAVLAEGKASIVLRARDAQGDPLDPAVADAMMCMMREDLDCL